MTMLLIVGARIWWEPHWEPCDHDSPHIAVSAWNSQAKCLIWSWVKILRLPLYQFLLTFGTGPIHFNLVTSTCSTIKLAANKITLLHVISTMTLHFYIVSGIYSDVLSEHSFGHSIWHYLGHSSRIYYDILSGILHLFWHSESFWPLWHSEILINWFIYLTKTHSINQASAIICIHWSFVILLYKLVNPFYRVVPPTYNHI